jgi:hypothetical protein
MSNAGNQRNKPSLVGAGLPEETRRAMNQAFDALSDWRNELSSVTERKSVAVFDKMGQAAKAMGWPAEFVDMTRQQMQQASKLQMQLMDQVMDIWEQQMKNPGAPVTVPGMAAEMPQFPGAMPGFGIPGMPGLDMNAAMANPMQFWMQAANMWQQSCQQAFSAFMDMQKSMIDQSGRGGR